MAWLRCDRGGQSGYDEVVYVGHFNVAGNTWTYFNVTNLVDDVSVVTVSDFIVDTTVLSPQYNATGQAIPFSRTYNNSTGQFGLVYATTFAGAQGDVYLKIHH